MLRTVASVDKWTSGPAYGDMNGAASSVVVALAEFGAELPCAVPQCVAPVGGPAGSSGVSSDVTELEGGNLAHSLAGRRGGKGLVSREGRQTIHYLHNKSSIKKEVAKRNKNTRQ